MGGKEAALAAEADLPTHGQQVCGLLVGDARPAGLLSGRGSDLYLWRTLQQTRF